MLFTNKRMSPDAGQSMAEGGSAGTARETGKIGLNPGGGNLGGQSAKANPDIGPVGVAPGGTTEHAPDAGQLPGAAAKAVGGGLEPGSTDWGSSTASTAGGRTGFGSDASRSVTSGPGSAAASPAGGSAGIADTGMSDQSGPAAA